MHVSYYQVKYLIMIGRIVDELSKLRREERNVVWFKAVKVTKEYEPSFRMFGFQ